MFQIFSVELPVILALRFNMLEISMGESCVKVFQLINDSPQTEPVSGGCADNGTDSNCNCTER